MKTRVIELSVNNRKEVIELPINPPSVEFTEKQLNQAITLLNIGELVVPIVLMEWMVPIWRMCCR